MYDRTFSTTGHKREQFSAICRFASGGVGRGLWRDIGGALEGFLEGSLEGSLEVYWRGIGGYWRTFWRGIGGCFGGGAGEG